MEKEEGEELEKEQGEELEQGKELEKEQGEESEKEESDNDWENMYLPKKIDKNGIGKDGNESEGMDNAREFGGNNDGEGSHSIEHTAATGLARTRKRKVTHDDKPVTTTRAAGKRKKVDNGGGDQVASRSVPSTKKALSKRRK